MSDLPRLAPGQIEIGVRGDVAVPWRDARFALERHRKRTGDFAITDLR